MLRRFSSSPCASTAVIPWLAATLSSVALYSSQSNGIDRKQARRYRANSVLLNDEKRSQVDSVISSSGENIVLNLRNDDNNISSSSCDDAAGSAPHHDHHQQEERAGDSGRSPSSSPPPSIPPATAWWADACVLRRNRESRRVAHAAVVGGESNIRRIWKNLGITPRCMFVPDSEPVPEWMMSSSSSSTSPPKRLEGQEGKFTRQQNEEAARQRKRSSRTVIVRAPGAEINRELLSAERNDGFAAEFPLPIRMPREYALLSPEEQQETRPNTPPLRLSRVVVAHGLRVPSNVGSIIKNARSAGYDAVILDRCCELTSEKVLRAAGDAAFDARFHIFEFGHKMHCGSTRIDGERDNATQWAEGVNSALLLKRIAASHGLLPMMLVPQTIYSSAETGDSYDVFSVAQKFHHAAYKEKQKMEQSGEEMPHELKLGAMLVVGGEAHGLRSLASDWNRDALHVPMLPVSVRMDNPQVNSINVAAAASVAMQLFRPRAADEFAEYFRRGIVPPESGAEEWSDDMKNVPELDTGMLLGQLTAARNETSAGLLSK